jgi:hypothetical protein
VIHYHGVTISPNVAAVAALRCGHAFVSFEYPEQLPIVVEVAQSFAIDNGAFSAWKNGAPVRDWRAFYEWSSDVRRFPSCDFAVIPDAIEGAEATNDALIREWPLGTFGAPVWHMHESLARLERLVHEWPRVCLGSSGEFATIGGARWWTRIAEAMEIACDADGFPRTRLHGLRMLDPEVFSRLPLSSADSTNIGRNVGIDSKWPIAYAPPNKETRAAVLRARIESVNAPARWDRQPIQEALCLL